MCFLSFLRRKLLSGTQAALCPKGSDSCCLQAAHAFLCWMTSLGRLLCQYAVSSCQKWPKVSFCGIDHCSLHWLHCWARWWMFQDMDTTEASCDLYFKVSTFTHPERSKTALLSGNELGIVRLTVQHDLIVSISFMYYPGVSLRQTSADVLSFKQCPIDHWQSCNFDCRTPQFIPVNKHTTMDGHIAPCGAVGNPSNLRLYARGSILSIRNMLAANYSILTWS